MSVCDYCKRGYTLFCMLSYFVKSTMSSENGEANKSSNLKYGTKQRRGMLFGNFIRETLAATCNQYKGLLFV